MSSASVQLHYARCPVDDREEVAELEVSDCSASAAKTDYRMRLALGVEHHPGQRVGLPSRSELAAEHQLGSKAHNFIVEVFRCDGDDVVLWAQCAKSISDHFTIQAWLVGKQDSHVVYVCRLFLSLICFHDAMRASPYVPCQWRACRTS